MTDQNSSTTPKRPAPGRSITWLLKAWQALFALFLLLLTLGLLAEASRLSVPDAPKALFWASIAAGSFVALVHAPPLFMKLPRKGKSAVYLAAVAFFALWNVVASDLRAKWELTPEGAAQAQHEEMERQAVLATEKQRQNAEAQIAEARQLQRELEDYADKIEGCFSVFGGGIPALKNAIKSNLHDPGSFEHVQTIVIVSDDEQNNVAMQFRATNGFGAVRTAQVKALVNPDSCDVVRVDEAEVL